MRSLFPCLPDELGLECLVRVKLNSHHNLRCVSKSWNAALKSPHFYQERKRLKISEQRICILSNTGSKCNSVVVYDPEKNSCKTLPLIPTGTNGIYHCHFVKQKLVLITDLGYDFKRSFTWIYDFSCSKWQKGTKLPRTRIGFACAADEHRGLIYVGGGFRNDIFGQPFRSAYVYSVEENKWDALPDMNTDKEFFTGFFSDGKFFVMGNPSEPSFEVFDPCTKSWRSVENRINSWHRLVSTFGRFKGFSDRGLIEYDYSQDKLHVVGLLPTENLNRFIKLSLVVGQKIFLINRDAEEGEGFYLLEPPGEIGGAIKWIRIERPSNIQGSVLQAVTLDM